MRNARLMPKGKTRTRSSADSVFVIFRIARRKIGEPLLRMFFLLPLPHFLSRRLARWFGPMGDVYNLQPEVADSAQR